MVVQLMQMAGCRSRMIRSFLPASGLPREGGECVNATKDGDDLVDHLNVIQVGDVSRDLIGWRVSAKPAAKRHGFHFGARIFAAVESTTNFRLGRSEDNDCAA
jgi:hypothetical protein